jgi:hypothetical protein
MTQIANQTIAVEGHFRPVGACFIAGEFRYTKYYMLMTPCKD